MTTRWHRGDTLRAMPSTHAWWAVAAALVSTPTIVAQVSPTTDQELAAAKIAELAGKLEEAEAALQRALAAASDARRAECEAALRQFRSRYTPRALAQKEKRGDDPLARLIAVLDTGVAGNGTDAGRASVQIAELGRLAVPALLDALPTLNAFGIHNALRLLGRIDDASLGSALAGKVDDAGPLLRTGLAEQLGALTPSVAAPLAHALAKVNEPPVCCSAARRALLRLEPEAESTRQLAAGLADGSRSQALDLLAALDECDPSWAQAVRDHLRASAGDVVRSAATRAWLRHLPDTAEDQALDVLKHAAPADLSGLAQAALATHGAWSRIGVLLLRQTDVGDGLAQIVGTVRWGRTPAESGAALLALPPAACPVQLCGAVQELVEHGWRCPTALVPRLLALQVEAQTRGIANPQVLQALAPGDEDAVLACWDDLPNRARITLAGDVRNLGYAWHRLLAQGLRILQVAEVDGQRVLVRDWTGAPDEVFDTLTALATGASVNVADVLLQAAERSPGLPTRVLVPLLAGDRAENALHQIAARDPHAALAGLAARKPLPAGLAGPALELLCRYGTHDDLPLALRLVREFDFDVRGEVGRDQLVGFLTQRGAGDLDVVRLAMVPTPVTLDPDWHPRLQVAASAAAAVKVDAFEAALRLAPHLPGMVASPLLHRLTELATADHIPLLERVTAATCSEEPAGTRELDSRTVGIGPWARLSHMVAMLGHSNDARALPALRRVMTLEKRSGEWNGAVSSSTEDLRAAAAEAGLAVAGDGRRALLTELLASPRAELVRVALRSPDVAADPELTAAARAALLRVGAEVGDPQAFFANLHPTVRAATAREVLTDPRLPTFATPLAITALNVLGDTKEQAQVDALAAAGSHPDPVVRRFAAVQLGRTVSAAAAERLLDLTRDQDPTVRTAADAALDDIEKWHERAKRLGVHR